MSGQMKYLLPVKPVSWVDWSATKLTSGWDWMTWGLVGYASQCEVTHLPKEQGLTYFSPGQSLQQIRRSVCLGVSLHWQPLLCQVCAISHAKASSTFNPLQVVYMKWYVKNKFMPAWTLLGIIKSMLICSHSGSQWKVCLEAEKSSQVR